MCLVDVWVCEVQLGRVPALLVGLVAIRLLDDPGAPCLCAGVSLVQSSERVSGALACLAAAVIDFLELLNAVVAIDAEIRDVEVRSARLQTVHRLVDAAEISITALLNILLVQLPEVVHALGNLGSQGFDS